MSDSKIIKKLFKIAKNQQKIINKLAQSPELTREQLTSLVRNISKTSKDWVLKNIGDGIINVKPRLSYSGSGKYEIEVWFTVSPDEVKAKLNTQIGQYEEYMNTIIQQIIPADQYTLLVMVNP